MTFIPNFPPPPSALRKEVRVLVVDDAAEHFELLVEVAEMYNPAVKLECRHIDQADQTLTVVDEWQPSVVLLDLHSCADAVALLEQLALVGPPVVATSTHRSRELSSVADAHGAVGYLSKSDNIEDLEALVVLLATVSVAPPPRQ
jgi:CheY-like chemotaxis protein